MAKLMIPCGHPADPAAFEDHYASRHMPYTVEQADGDKPTSDSPPPFGRAITGRSAWHRSRTWHTYWPRRFGIVPRALPCRNIPARSPAVVIGT